MTKEEVTKKSQEKINTITKLCEQLEVTVSAEEMITNQGFIKKVVYYTDNEKYDVDKEPVTPQTNEDKKDEPKTEEAEPVKA